MTVNRALEDSLMDAPVKVDVVLGEARMPMEELMGLSEGEIVELENQTTDLVDIYVSDRLMARGRLVVADGQLGVTLSDQHRRIVQDHWRPRRQPHAHHQGGDGDDAGGSPEHVAGFPMDAADHDAAR